MSNAPTECPACDLRRGQIALLEAEIGGLRRAVLDLTRDSASHGPELEIIGMHEAEALRISGPSVQGDDVFYRVSMTYRNQLSAHCDIAGIDPATFLQFFEDLEQHWNGWQGEKKVASLEGQLVIACTYDGKQYRPEVSMDVFCALDLPSFDPIWTVKLRLDVAPVSLLDLGAQARVVFGNVVPSNRRRDHHAGNA